MKQHLTNTVFDRFQAFILKESGLDFKNHHKKNLEEKCLDRMKVCKIKAFTEYLNFIMFTVEGTHEFKSLLDLITVGETYFFRNKPQFEGLRDYVVPKLLRANLSKLKIWCAGCSTGEEPYTLAMVLRECAPSLRFSIIATDINRRSLAAAQKGIYSTRSIRNVRPDLLNTYFKKHGSYYTISEDIKSSVNFIYHNLAASEFSHHEMQGLDMLLCRNVTIYFDEKTLKKVIGKFVPCLSSGGFLFIGHAETLRGISDDFNVIQQPGTIIYEKKVSAPAPVLEKNNTRETVGNVPETVSETVPDIQFMPVDTGRTCVTAHLENLLDEAAAALKCKEYDKAVLSLDKYLKAHPDDSNALMLKGEILGNQRFFKDALTSIDKAIERDNLSIKAYCLKGTLLADMGKYSEAVLQFKRVLYLEPDNCISHYHLGNMYRHMGETVKAVKEYGNCHNILKRVNGAEAVPLSHGIKAVHLNKSVVNALKELKATARD